MANESGQDERQALSESLAQALPRLTAEQIAEVSPHFGRASYAPGEAILTQNDPPERFYILLSGNVEVSHLDTHGQQHIIDTHGPGHTFGEIGLLKDVPRTATVRAVDQTDVLTLERDDFLTLVHGSRATETQVMQDLIRNMITLANSQG
jgi:CRP-like cAMP-binding protein